MVAIYPELIYRSIAAHQVFYGTQIHLLVGTRVLARRLDGPVPGRKVDAQLYAKGIACVTKGRYDIQLVPAKRVGHIGRTFRVVPEAKAIVMLGREDHFLESVFRCHADPLGGIQPFRLVVLHEELLAPGLALAEGVRAVGPRERGLSKVVEHNQFLPLPVNLRRCGANAKRLGWGTGSARKQGGQRREKENPVHLRV